MDIELTTMSPKGQVVIPQGIRQGLKIKPGAKFAVYGAKDSIIFKKVELPSVDDFIKLNKWGKDFARKKGITEGDVLKDD